MRYTNYENDILSAPIATVGANTRHWDRSSVLFSFLFFFPSCLSSFFLFFPFFYLLSPVRTDSSGPTISVDCLKVHVPTISHVGADSCRTFFCYNWHAKIMKITFCLHGSQRVGTICISTTLTLVVDVHLLSFYCPSLSYFLFPLLIFFLSFSFLSVVFCLSPVGTDSLGPTVFRRLSQGTDN